MKFIADFHIHSKYSRATSKYMDLEYIAQWAKQKGINVIGTGDFTHPLWRRELKSKLKQNTDGLYEYKGIRFILTAEVSNMYKKNGHGRRIHTILFAPDFEAADKIGGALNKRGNVTSDGRPIFGFDVKDIVKIALDASEHSFVIPAHCWTPWFSVFGSMSGFDSIEECFEEEADNIYALETGLSADPAMCWRVSAFDKYSLVSNSDAHSPAKLGREANVFDTELSYYAITEVLKTRDRKRFLYTIEFFPEEGKYHYDGHRLCNICFAPRQTKACGGVCPACGKSLTIGVMNRVEQLADRPEGFRPVEAVPFKSLVPLVEIISETQGKGVASKAVQKEYQQAINAFGNEFSILLYASPEELYNNLSRRVAGAVLNIRNGDVDRIPGYDGVYGKIRLAGNAQPDEQGYHGEFVNAAN
ncbi:MAG: DNA helicase UvrD [Dehalococcoidia bacterium]|nr:MAG: DNA helicase UvrD [Dehalococcoidia bacterium]